MIENGASKMVLTVECCGLMPRRLDTMRATVGFFDGVANSLRNGWNCDDAEFAECGYRDSNWCETEQAIQKKVRTDRLGLCCRAGPRRRLSLKVSWQVFRGFRSEERLPALTTPSHNGIE
jgi:hypothetical protein